MKFLLPLFCFIATASAGTSVVGGDPASNGAYPYQASLKVSGTHICGASILNNLWLCSAAHCNYISTTPFTVYVGSNQLNGLLFPPGTSYRVAQTIVHENFNKTVFLENDIMLIKVAQKIVYGNNVQPISIDLNPVPGDTTNIILTGWGYTAYPENTRTNTLQVLKMTSISNDICQLQMGSNVVTSGMMCTFNQTGKGACFGDSGGPLALNGKLVGIMSWIIPCGEGYPDVSTRMSEYGSWIAPKIA